MPTAGRTGFLRPLLLALAALTALAGCRDRNITTYDVPKETDPSPLGPAVPADAGMSAQTVPVAPDSGGSLAWQAPSGWQSQPGNAMRKGSFAVGAEGVAVSITAFPGDVGGVLANVNRWRGQVGLPPVDEAGLGAATTAFDSHGLHFIVVDAANASQRIVAALTPWNGGTWFFKLTGPAAAAAGAKPAFLDFLKTVHAP